MPGLDDAHSGAENRLLAGLPREDYERLLPDLESVSLGFQEVLYKPDKPIPYVYFPTTGVVSLLTLMEDGLAIEIAAVGREGMIGLPVFLEATSMPGSACTQVPGTAVRIPAERFREAVQRSGSLQRVLHRYTQALLNQIARSAACNRLHPIGERCARWLLMTHDRAGSDQFPLTHEFLAQMLGVRRATVTVAAGMLQQAGLIRYRRGKITIADRLGLETASCECYEVIRKEFDRLLP